MIPALFIAAFVVVVGVILYIFELRWRRKHGAESGERASSSGRLDKSEADRDVASVRENNNAVPNSEGGKSNSEGGEPDSGECCGLHLVCEKDSLSPMSAEVIYYDDEELDRFVGRSGDSYTPEEEEEFREVLMTLRPEDVAGWARSITQRRLELPSDVRDSLLMLVREQRDAALYAE